jgi:hypothetical protein
MDINIRHWHELCRSCSLVATVLFCQLSDRVSNPTKISAIWNFEVSHLQELCNHSSLLSSWYWRIFILKNAQNRQRVLMRAYVVNGKSCRRNDRIITLSQNSRVIRRLLQLQWWRRSMVVCIWSEFRFILRNGTEIELTLCEIWVNLTYFL